MIVLFWFVVSFFSGALPFSVWVGRWALHQDIRAFGDHNPGMTNVFRAGGKGWGVLAMLLDGFKGAIPVGLAYWVFGWRGWGMAAVAVAPVLGHAFSPLLGFRGGKAVAVTFGVWTGLTLFMGPLMLGITLGLLLTLTASDAWPLFPAMFVLLLVLWEGHASDWMLGAWAADLLILVWKHRRELRQPPRLRDWLRRLARLKDE